MNVFVDAGRCELHGECVMAAPTVFEISEDETETVTLLDAEPDETLRNAVEEAALLCPVAAIVIEG
jgi:ferredoxin